MSFTSCNGQPACFKLILTPRITRKAEQNLNTRLSVESTATRQEAQRVKPNIWYISSSRFLPVTYTAAAEAEKLSKTVGDSMGLGQLSFKIGQGRDVCLTPQLSVSCLNKVVCPLLTAC